MIADSAMQSATTAKGGTFRAFSSSWSKYRMRPAAEWNPWSLFRAMVVSVHADTALKDFPRGGHSRAASTPLIRPSGMLGPSVPSGPRDGRDRRRVHRNEADDELRSRGRHALQRGCSIGHREGSRMIDLYASRCSRGRPPPID